MWYDECGECDEWMCDTHVIWFMWWICDECDVTHVTLMCNSCVIPVWHSYVQFLWFVWQIEWKGQDLQEKVQLATGSIQGALLAPDTVAKLSPSQLQWLHENLEKVWQTNWREIKGWPKCTREETVFLWITSIAAAHFSHWSTSHNISSVWVCTVTL